MHYVSASMSGQLVLMGDDIKHFLNWYIPQICANFDQFLQNLPMRFNVQHSSPFDQVHILKCWLGSSLLQCHQSLDLCFLLSHVQKFATFSLEVLQFFP